MLLHRVIVVSVVLLAVAWPVFALFPILFELGIVVLGSAYLAIVNEIRKEFALNRAAQTIAKGNHYNKQIAVKGGTLYLWWEDWQGHRVTSESDITNAVSEIIKNLNAKTKVHGFSNLVQNAKCPPAGGLGWEFIPGGGANNARGSSGDLKMLWHPNNTGAVVPSVHYDKLPEAAPLPTGPRVNGEELCKRGELYRTLYKCGGPSTLLPGQKLGKGASIWSKNGARLYVENGGNLCLYTPAGKNYWCMNWVEPKGNFWYRLETDGRLCRHADDGYDCTQVGKYPNDSNYRLTLQTDGNLVVYRGAGMVEPVWYTMTNIFKANVKSPCW